MKGQPTRTTPNRPVTSFLPYPSPHAHLSTNSYNQWSTRAHTLERGHLISDTTHTPVHHPSSLPMAPSMASSKPHLPAVRPHAPRVARTYSRTHIHTCAHPHQHQHPYALPHPHVRYPSHTAEHGVRARRGAGQGIQRSCHVGRQDVRGWRHHCGPSRD